MCDQQILSAFMHRNEPPTKWYPRKRVVSINRNTSTVFWTETTFVQIVVSDIFSSPIQTKGKVQWLLGAMILPNTLILVIGPMKWLFRHTTFVHIFIPHTTFRLKFAWYRHSKFSLTPDTLASKALKRVSASVDTDTQNCQPDTRHDTPLQPDTDMTTP